MSINENAMRQMALQVAATQTNDETETIAKAKMYLDFLMIEKPSAAEDEQDQPELPAARHWKLGD